MDIGIIMSWWTVVAMAFFVLIVIWAWSDRRKQSFEEASRIPLENDDKAGPPEPDTGETRDV